MPCGTYTEQGVYFGNQGGYAIVDDELTVSYTITSIILCQNCKFMLYVERPDRDISRINQIKCTDYIYLCEYSVLFQSNLVRYRKFLFLSRPTYFTHVTNFEWFDDPL